MQIVKKTHNFVVRVYPESGIVSHQMLSFVEGEDFKDMMLSGLAAYREHGCSKWLSDDSRTPLTNQEDLEWGRANWEPGVIEAGWKYWAIIVPEKIFAKMSMRGIIQRYKKLGITAEVFKSYDDGLAWLEKQN